MIHKVGNFVSKLRNSEGSTTQAPAEAPSEHSTLKTPAQLRSAGDRHRDQANWPAAAFFYTRLLQLEPEDAALWLQQGHMLKESGMLGEADRSYERARQLRPTDPEIPLQRAILAKLMCEFDRAVSLYQEALQMGYLQTDFINQELAFLRRTANTPPRRSVVDNGQPMIYLSSVALPVSEADPTRLQRILGGTNYSYAQSMRGYQFALEQAGYMCEVIENPEYIPDIRLRSSASLNIHIGFYPPDGPRYLKGASNVVCLAWEFERLKTSTETGSYHAFADPVAMLCCAQQVWAVSPYSREAIKRSGVPNVISIPTPVPPTKDAGRLRQPSLGELQRAALKLERLTWVPLAVWPRMQSTVSRHARERQVSLLSKLLDCDDEHPPIVFVSIFNVSDYRKQTKPMIEAFVRFTQTCPNSLLLLKMSDVRGNLDINTLLFREQIEELGEMTPPLFSDRILLSRDALSRDEMNQLYDMASYYICTSHAEGQNLPLIEAMGRGVVPISTDQTAMQDYISEEDAIVLPSNFAPLTPRLTNRYNLYGVKTHYVEARDVYAALVKAQNISSETYAALSQNAHTRVRHLFGSDAFATAVKQAISNLMQSIDAPAMA